MWAHASLQKRSLNVPKRPRLHMCVTITSKCEKLKEKARSEEKSEDLKRKLGMPGTEQLLQQKSRERKQRDLKRDVNRSTRTTERFGYVFIFLFKGLALKPLPIVHVYSKFV